MATKLLFPMIQEQGCSNIVSKCLLATNKFSKCSLRCKSVSSHYSKHKYSPKLEKLINDQIRAEQQAAQDYLAMAVSFLHPAQAYPGAGGFFMKMYNEEIEHGQIFIQYQLLRGGVAEIGSLKSPEINMQLKLCEAFAKGLAMEKSITESIENLIKAAEEEKDYQCADFLTASFLAEQMKSINEFAFHVSRLSRLKEPHALYHYDLELKKSHPFEPKTISPSNNSMHV